MVVVVVAVIKVISSRETEVVFAIIQPIID